MPLIWRTVAFDQILSRGAIIGHLWATAQICLLKAQMIQPCCNHICMHLCPVMGGTRQSQLRLAQAKVIRRTAFNER